MMILVPMVLSIKGRFSNPPMTASGVFHAVSLRVLPPHTQRGDESFLLSLQKHPVQVQRDFQKKL
jgi:hypothetical protein